MNAVIKQEGLMLRQVIALRRQGLSHSAALALAAGGLTSPNLRRRVQEAQQALSAGQALSSDPLLSNGDVSIEALELSAEANDAQLALQAATSMVSMYLTIVMAGPPLLLCLLAWVGALLSGTWGWTVFAVLRWGGVPVAVMMGLLSRLLGRLFPVERSLRRAAHLLRAADAGEPLEPLLQSPEELMYLQRLSAQGDTTQAVREFAAELSRDGRRTLEFFRHVAPIVLGTLGTIVGVMCLVVFRFVMMATASL